jgi:hypothetical protein
MKDLPLSADPAHRPVGFPVSRREFLRNSGLAAGAVLLPRVEQFAPAAIPVERHQSGPQANQPGPQTTRRISKRRLSRLRRSESFP